MKTLRIESSGKCWSCGVTKKLHIIVYCVDGREVKLCVECCEKIGDCANFPSFSNWQNGEQLSQG